MANCFLPCFFVLPTAGFNIESVFTCCCLNRLPVAVLKLGFVASLITFNSLFSRMFFIHFSSPFQFDFLRLLSVQHFSQLSRIFISLSELSSPNVYNFSFQSAKLWILQIWTQVKVHRERSAIICCEIQSFLAPIESCRRGIRITNEETCCSYRRFYRVYASTSAAG